jgi:hypothetical protein
MESCQAAEAEGALNAIAVPPSNNYKGVIAA